MVWFGVFAVVAGLTVLCAGPALRALPRASDAPDYAGLVSARFLVGVGLTSLGTGWLAAWHAAHPIVWVVLAGPGVLLVAVDARTTWLPLPLTHVLWAGTAAGLALAALAEPAVLARSATAVLVALLLFWTLWRWGGMGFGDVRLAPALGAIVATQGWDACLLALVIGTLIGAGHAVWRLLRGRPGAFAYGPSLFAGAIATLLFC